MTSTLLLLLLNCAVPVLTAVKPLTGRDCPYWKNVSEYRGKVYD